MRFSYRSQDTKGSKLNQELLTPRCEILVKDNKNANRSHGTNQVSIKNDAYNQQFLNWRRMTNFGLRKKTLRNSDLIP